MKLWKKFQTKSHDVFSLDRGIQFASLIMWFVLAETRKSESSEKKINSEYTLSAVFIKSVVLNATFYIQIKMLIGVIMFFKTFW